MFASLKWRRETLLPDLGGGLSVALISIPEGMAYALVAGVNPIYGLYTGMLTTLVASLTANTSLLIVTSTNALALVTADHLGDLRRNADPATVLFTLTFLVGVIMAALGVLKLGSTIRFVSREVMSGFVFAAALLLVLGQLKDFVGYESTVPYGKVAKAIDTFAHIPDWNYADTAVGVISIVALILLGRSRLSHWAGLLVIFLATVFVHLASISQVKLVADVATVPSGLAALPTPVLPDITLIPALLVGAIAASVVGLAEGSSIGAAYPNRDGKRSDMSKDFLAQGLGNVAGSFFQAMPAGGSLSRTGVNVNGGALTRWAGVYSGILLAVVLILFGSYAGFIPMCGLSALLIFIGFGIMIREGRELAVAWKISRVNTVAAFLTIIIGATVDLTTAIFSGIGFSLLTYAVVSSKQFRIVRMIKRSGGSWEDHPLPETMPSNEAVVIEVRGTVFFASVYMFDELLPSLEGAKNSVAILRAPDRQLESLTALKWVVKYAAKLQSTGNKLMLADVEQRTFEKLESFGALDKLGRENVFVAQPTIHASIEEALAAAEAWIEEPKPEGPTDQADHVTS